MKLSARYGSHLPVLIQALAKTRGAVLELGMGLYSTPVLNAICTAERRELVSMENYLPMYEWAQPYANQFHTVMYISNWENAPIMREWDVVLIDHSPDERRALEIERLKNLAQLLVVHDSDQSRAAQKAYNLASVFPFFKWRYDFTDLEPATTVLSNRRDLSDFEKRGYRHRIWLDDNP